MTSLAARAPLRAGVRATGLAFESLRALAYAAAVVATTAALPDGASLALARWTGARVIHTGLAQAGPGWFGAVCTWLVASGGSAVPLAVAAVAALVALACTEQRAKLRSTSGFALGAVVIAAACSLDAFHAGGGAISAAFAAALALALARGGTRAPLLAGGLTALWCNVSADGALAPFVALTFALGTQRDGTASQAPRRAWYAAGACAFATLLTPAFAAFPAEAFAALHFDGTLEGIVATHPAQIAPAAYRVGFTLVVLAFIAFGSGVRLRVGDAALVTLATLLALENGALLAVFGVLVAPILAGSAYESFGRPPRVEAPHGAADVCLAIAALALAGCLAMFAAPRADAALASQPYALARAAALGNHHRFYCADVAWCGYAIATGPPGTSALLDGRTYLYAAGDVQAQRNIARAARGWRATLDRRRIDVLLVRRDRALATLLRMRGDWRPVASDATAELFVRAAALR
jgi:hypothetical protein